MTNPDASAGVPRPERERIALFRYRLIAEALNPRLRPRERGRLVREMASRQHEFPDGSVGTVSRNPPDRWMRYYRTHRPAGLVPEVRADAGVVRRHPELLEEAALRRERPDSKSPFGGLPVGQPALARQLRLGMDAAPDQRMGVLYSPRGTSPSPPTASSTTSPSPAAPTPCSPTTPSQPPPPRQRSAPRTQRGRHGRPHRRCLRT
jgi:hypothetical protein